MIDIDDAATRAVEAPIAPPPDLAHVERLAGRYRRRRAAIAATSGVTLVALVVGIGAALASRDGHSGVRVVAGTSASTQSAPVSTGSVPAADLTRDGLVARLAETHHVVNDGTAGGYPLAAKADLLCVDGTPVRVYEYADRAARAAVSATISADGSHFELPRPPNGTGVVIVDWVGPPHFFAAGRVIVLVLTDDRPVLEWLTDAMGPTLSPDAHGGTTLDHCGRATPSTTGP